MSDKANDKERNSEMRVQSQAPSEKSKSIGSNSDAIFRALFDNMTSGSAIYEVINDGSRGSDYIIRGFNRSSLQIEGKTLAEVLGKSLFDLRPNIDDYGLIDIMRQVWLTGEPALFPAKIYNDDMFSSYYENYVFRLPSGEVVTIYNDVTEQKNTELALKKSEERFALAMQFSNDGLYDWNLESNEIYFSSGWKKLLGYENSEIKNEFSEWERLTRPEDVQPSWQMLQDLLEGKRERFEMEFCMQHKDGHWVDILSRANVVRDAHGKAYRVVGTHVDISARKRAEEESRSRETLLNQMGSIAKIGGWEHDLVTRTATWTQETFNIVEIDGPTAPGPDEHLAYYPPKDRALLEAAYLRAVETGESFDLELQCTTAKGREIWARVMGQAEFRDGICVKMKGIFQDISEQKQTEQSLKAIQWLLHKSAGADANPAQGYGDLTKLNSNGLILNSIGRDVLEDIVTGYLELLDSSAAVYEKNGDYAHGIFASGWCRMLDSASYALCDTDDNAQALAGGLWLCHESCWSNASKTAIQTGAPVDVECHGGIRLYAVPIRANNEVIGCINFGYGDPPSDPEHIAEIAHKYNIPAEQLLAEALRYESRPAFIIDIAKSRLHSSAKLIGALVESKQAQVSLQKERERLNVTLRSIGDGAITTDVSGRVVLINRVAENLTGWSQDEAVGKKLDDVFHIINKQTRQKCPSPVEHVLATNTIVDLANGTVLLARDGSERIIADSGSPIVDAGGNTVGVVLVFRDITEKLALEAELHHAHKMEAIGHLAGGIAHEFNNVLGIVIGNTELALDDIEKWHPVAENLNEIKKASKRAKDVVKQLLSFGRKMDIKREAIDIRIIVKETLKLLRASLPSSVRMHEKLPTHIDTVVVDPTQIHQLMINLCNNAAQAMREEGGDLTIELGNVVIDDEFAAKHVDLQPGTCVRLRVQDTGPGIQPEHLGKIFDPYFTTKGMGEGTGLGLAVVHGIVKAHNGAISVNSQLGSGTAFELYFPATKAPISPQKSEVSEFVGGTERILFVDDEISIVTLWRRMFSKLGYTIVTELDPLKVLERFRVDPLAFDLVITDMTMPKMTGDKLTTELLKIRPDIPIIICTGFSEKVSSASLHELGAKALLMKPVEKAVLLNKVRQVLDEAAARRG